MDPQSQLMHQIAQGGSFTPAQSFSLSFHFFLLLHTFSVLTWDAWG